ncbi:Uncharacterized protein dnm_095500 [Desulfonema magnum]|uniref:Uncharacterized protein n=1 Tax=Desulfonema magnum TaxID=45655 RepID=A0A975GTT7_9BACT|nr:Uncharacterized protein dnm_095500 [Desulfonema magnum]
MRKNPIFSITGGGSFRGKTRVSFPGKYQKTYGLVLIFVCFTFFLIITDFGEAPAVNMTADKKDETDMTFQIGFPRHRITGCLPG